MVPFAPGRSVPTFHVSVCKDPDVPMIGDHTAGTEDTIASNVNPAGSVSFTDQGRATVPLLPYVMVYVIISPDCTTDLFTVFCDHKSTQPMAISASS